jgi:branched-chain amino acid transport system substrate-binding protein
VAQLISRHGFLGGTSALVAASTIAAPARAAYSPPISGVATIGVVAPFTGDDIRLGEQLANGVRAATDDANELRGPLDRAYAMRTFDDQDLLATGMQEAGFANDDSTIFAVVGHLSGRITEGAMDAYARAGMPVVCPASTYDRLTRHGYTNLLRLATRDSVEGELGARYIAAQIKPASIVTLTQDGDYGADVAQGFVSELGSTKIASNALLFPWDKPKFADVAKEALSHKPDVIYLAGLTKDMGPILPLLRDGGFTGPFFASQGFFDPLTISKYPTYVEGLTVSTSMPPLQIAPGAFRILQDYQKKYGPMTPLAAFGYASAQIIISIVRRTNAEDRVPILRAFGTFPTYDTVVGEFQFSNSGDPLNPQSYFYQVRNGAWHYLGSALPNSFVVK